VKKERTRSQIARGARNKGSSAERTVAKLLGLCFFGDEEFFHRSPASGGLRWKKNVGGTRGDIVAPEEIGWPFSIEIKNTEKGGWDLFQVLFNHGPILKEWWDQAHTDADEVNAGSKKYVHPWLIFKRNQVPFLMVMGESCFLNTLPVVDKLYLPMGSYFHLPEQGLYIMPLSAFLLSNLKYKVEELLDKNPDLIKRHLINPMKGIAE